MYPSNSIPEWLNMMAYVPTPHTNRRRAARASEQLAKYGHGRDGQRRVLGASSCGMQEQGVNADSAPLRETVGANKPNQEHMPQHSNGDAHAGPNQAAASVP
jgi:hypothetical protein